MLVPALLGRLRGLSHIAFVVQDIGDEIYVTSQHTGYYSEKRFASVISFSAQAY